MLHSKRWVVAKQAATKQDELELLWWPSGMALYCSRGFTCGCPAKRFCRASALLAWGEERARPILKDGQITT